MKHRILRLPEVCEWTGLATSTVYYLMAKGRFPRQIRISPAVVGWKSSDIEGFLAEREQESIKNRKKKSS